MKTSPDMTTIISMVVGLVVALAMIICFTVLLINHVIDISQIGPFLIALAVPLAALAGLPLFHAALQAPSPAQATQANEQMTQLGQLAQQVLQQPAAASSPLVVIHATQPTVQTQPVVQPATDVTPTLIQPVPTDTQLGQPGMVIAPLLSQETTTAFQPQFVPTGGQWPPQQPINRHFETMSNLQAVQPPTAPPAQQ